MKRICLVRMNYFPGEAHVRKNAEALTSAGYQVDVICLRDHGEKARQSYGNGTIYRLPLVHRRTGALRYIFEYAAFFILAFALLSFLAIRRRYQIVEIYNLPDFLVFTAAVPKLLGSRVILYLFEGMPETFADRFGLAGDGVRIRSLRWLERLSATFSDRDIVVGPHERLQREQRGISAGKIAVVMNVPEDDLFEPGDQPAAPDGGVNLITHGSILKRYGIQTLIRAVPKLREKLPHVQVWVVGDGEYREKLESLAEALGVRSEVCFTGLVPHEEVAGYIARCQIGIMPALHSILPNKLFEYISMGKPVVCADLPSIRAVFDDSTMLFYRRDDHEELAQRVLELHTDPAKGERLAQEARGVFRDYSWSRMKDVYIGLHDELISPSKHSAPEAPVTPGEAPQS